MTSSSKSKVCFFFNTAVSLRNRTKLKNFIQATFRNEKKNLKGINYIFCTDKELLAINRQYLKHDYYTDIITFDLSDEDGPVVAEVYISVERVRDNAQQLSQTFGRELHRVMFHGVLHLCGYMDKTKEEKKKMRGREEILLLNYFK